MPARPVTAADLTAWLRAMPKAELHLHLDGSLRPLTALELARERDVGSDAASLDVARMRDLLVAPERCRDQVDLLRAFALPVALLQDAESLARVAQELVEDVRGDGTRYAEIRWAPSLHRERGLPLRDGIRAVVEAATATAAALGIHVRLIAVALRTHAPSIADEVARESIRFVDAGLTGFDLAGRERDARDPSSFARAFEVAREGGMGITCHAGEWGGAAQVRRALSVGPWRIAHGAPAADDAALMSELIGRGVTLDICPTSNIQAGVGAWDARAPLPRLVRAGVPVTISTDDRTVSDVDLVRELERVIERLGVPPDRIAAIVGHAYDVAFLHHDEALRQGLRRDFDAWIAANPAPRQPEHPP